MIFISAIMKNLRTKFSKLIKYNSFNRVLVTAQYNVVFLELFNSLKKTFQTRYYQIFIISLLCCLILLTSFCQPEISMTPVQPISKSELNILLEESKGKVVVLNFWATWCKSCKSELKILASLKREYKQKNLQVIAVSIDPHQNKKRVELVQSIYKDVGFFDENFISRQGQVKDVMTVVDSEWLEIVPITYLIDRNGLLIKRYIGSRSIERLIVATRRRLK